VLAPVGHSVHGQFVEAARDGQYRTRLEYLLAQGADVDSKDESGVAALHYAAFRGDHENVRLLLSRGADVNTEHVLFGRPICMAALRRHTQVVGVLLEHKADLALSCRYMSTALHCACFGGDVAIFESMLENGEGRDLARSHVVHLGALAFMADMDLGPNQAVPRWRRNPRLELETKCSPILLAAERCHFDLLRLCQSKSYDAYRSPGAWGQNPAFASAASAACTEVSGSSAFSAWSSLGFLLPVLAANFTAPMAPTMLMWGAATLNLPLIEHLLESGEPTDTEDGTGRSALHYAALPVEHATFEDVEKCFQRLLQGSPINSLTDQNLLMLTVSHVHSALDPRISHKWGSDVHARCITSLLDHIASEHEKRTSSSEALLSIFAYHMYPADSIKLLCKNAQLLKGNPSQLTKARGCFTMALHHAIDGDASSTIISILLDHGADPNDCSGSERLPLTATVLRLANRDIISVLLNSGADPNMIEQRQPWKGETPYSLAVNRGEQDVIKLFARVISERTPTTRRANEAADSVSSRSTMAAADAVNDSTGCENAKPVAKATPRASQRSWFAGLSAISLLGLRKNSKFN
jgi:ankyrin repeat protein